MKSLVDKTVANQKMIETRRKHVSFGVGDSQKIQVWEAQVGNDGTPLLACYNNWKKVSQLQQAKKVSEQEKMDDYSHIPQLKKNHKKIRMKQEAESEVGGFLSGSDDDFDDVENFKLKEERGKKRKSDDSSDEGESDDDENREEEEGKAENTQQEESEDESEDDAEGDAVEDLRLEDLDSESDAEMADEFDDDEDEDENDNDPSDEESEDESD